jgi:hypothetical protein
VGYLNKGDRTYYSIDFPYVYRRLDKAASFMITIETKGKGSKSTKTYKTTSTTANPEGTTTTDMTTKVTTETTSNAPPPKVEVEPLPKP